MAFGFPGSESMTWCIGGLSDPMRPSRQVHDEVLEDIMSKMAIQYTHVCVFLLLWVVSLLRRHRGR